MNSFGQPDSEAFRASVRAVLEATPVAACLLAHSAVVLERIVFGAGATRWFALQQGADLGRLVARLNPGSLISFYFAGQIANVTYDGRMPPLDGRMAVSGPEVAGVLASDGFAIDCDFPTGLDEFRAFLSDVAVGARLFYGAFPGRENDGVSGVTVALPFRDGVDRRRAY